MKIGIISDTHGYLNPQILKIFSDVDQIFHAGDIGNIEILETLKSIAPVKAIYGNVDAPNLRQILPPRLTAVVEELTVLMIHDIGTPQHFLASQLFSQIKPTPDIVIFGHTHVPYWEFQEGILLINPGSATKPQPPHKPTVMLLEVDKREIVGHQLISL